MVTKVPCDHAQTIGLPPPSNPESTPQNTLQNWERLDLLQSPEMARPGISTKKPKSFLKPLLHAPLLANPETNGTFPRDGYGPAAGVSRWISLGLLQEEDKRATTNVQHLDLSSSFYYLFFSFVLIELKPFVLKGKVPGKNYEKVWKSAKNYAKNYETILPFSCCPLVFL